MVLRTVEYWEGNNSKEIRYKATVAPWVVNGGYTPTSEIRSNFWVTVWKEVGPFRETSMSFTSKSGVQSTVLEETGEFIIEIEATGSNWWVKVGVER